MDLSLSPVFLSRIQFSLTIMFHILWPVLIVGLSIYLLGVEVLWNRTRERHYYQQARFWQKLFFLVLAMGVISGIPMEFQFGTNWSGFSIAGGDIFGHMLGFEAAMAFMLEATFLGIMAYGWDKVSPRTHLFSTAMVAFGASLSAFWIMVANSWMQIPRGGDFIDGSFVMTNSLKAIFNPDIYWSFSHMWVACLEITLFVIGGLSGWYILKGRQIRFFLKSFKIAAAAAVVITPLQIFLGDGSGQVVGQVQPEKLAAIEAHWETNPAGLGAAWKVLARPDPSRQENRWALEVPFGLSLIMTRSLTGQVRGLREFAKENQPPVWIPFYSFRIMIAIGTALFLLMLWTMWTWRKGGLEAETAPGQRKLLWSWILAVPLSYLAMETGWITREVGRQPWIIYNVQRTSEAVSPLSAGPIWWSLLTLGALYLVLLFVFCRLARRVISAGPEADHKEGG
ncbi:MAG: cytochrome ubiquinol oxidase subunit I [Desulfohalobiaceae bacterium]|nr:cytochrome ubiquinol oxidase subunit I [Desulfohalobiaceae bacterium]